MDSDFNVNDCTQLQRAIAKQNGGKAPIANVLLGAWKAGRRSDISPWDDTRLMAWMASHAPDIEKRAESEEAEDAHVKTTGGDDAVLDETGEKLRAIRKIMEAI